MTKKPTFRLGDYFVCPECQSSFQASHPKQRFCQRSCAVANKTKRPRIRSEQQQQIRRENHRRWREANAERLKQKKRAYYEEHKQEVSDYQKAYKAALPKEKLKEMRRRWYKSDAPRRQRQYQESRIVTPWLNSLRGSKQRAKAEGIPFSLTREWCQERWTGNCEVTGIPFVMSDRRNPYLYSPSLDRIEPTKGYCPDNCRFVIHAVNALKGAGTDEDMIVIAKAIVTRFSPAF